MLCCTLALAACGGGGGDDGGASNNTNNGNNTVNQAPSNVAFNSVTALNATTIEAAWSLAKDDKTIASTMRYQVHLSESANFSPSSTTLKFEQRGGLATQLTGLKASTTYFVKLVVIDEDNAQTVSVEKSVTTPAVAVTNQAPSNVFLGNVTVASETAVVSWTAASDDTTPANQLTYEVHLAEGGDFSPSASTLKFSGKNVLSTQLTGLKAATSYSVKLVAVDAQGAKTVSAVKSVTTLSDTVADFTKISSTGQKLPVNATSWSCVLANRTGLMWEVKTDDGGLRDKDNDYKWYNPDSATNGGFEGYSNDGNNTYTFVRAVNTQGLCGYSNWRLPTVQELQSIVLRSTSLPLIDSAYFPNTISNYYWSSSPYAPSKIGAWTVAFGEGPDYGNNKDFKRYVRVVRSNL